MLPMQATDPPTLPLDPPGTPRLDACASCGTPMADDQRYCLDCGEPRARAATPAGALALASGASPGERTPRSSVGSPNTTIAGIGCLLLAMGVGVLIGHSSGASRTAGGSPQVISVAAGAATPAIAASFTDDWPAGTSGFTVELAVLSDQAGVASAKTAATAKGAKGVGALKSDNYSGLPAGSFIVYSGVYPKRAQAVKALGRLKARFPGASVIALTPVGGANASGGPRRASAAPGASPTVNKAAPAAVKALQGLSGQAYVKKSKQLPNVISTGGKPPPVDKTKPAGGGTSFSTIG